MITPASNGINPRVSKLAVAAFLFGCMALLFWWSRAVFLLVLAVPLGPVAVLAALFALWTIRRRPEAVRGRRLALWGGALGASASVLSVVALSRLFAQQFNPADFRDQQAQELQRIVRRAPALRESAEDFSSNLPVIVLRGDERPSSKHQEVIMEASVYDTAPGGRASVRGPASHEGLVALRPRGNSSLHLPKRSYTLQTLDVRTNQTKVPLLGLPKEEDWVLYASFEDKTLMRDVLAYRLSNEMGQYAPRTRYVELFIQRSSRPLSMRDYEGVYVLVEKIKRGRDRVNVAKLGPDDQTEPAISGGYIVKRDHSEGGGKRFRTERGGPYFYVYPNERNITAEQRAWIRNYFRAFEEALYGDAFDDPETGYAAYLDVGAFIDLHWLVELSKNVDGFRYSAYLTKDRDGKLKPGPAWDWNRAFGNANYYNGWQTHGWYSRMLRPNEISWYARLREDPVFDERCRARWRELRKTVLDPRRITALIDAMAAELEEAQRRNFARWPVLGQQVTCNHFVGESYAEEVRWLQKWIERRIAWIDRQVGETNPEPEEGNAEDSGG